MVKANQTSGTSHKKQQGAQFRFHKHLDTSQYNEFLAASDDEDFFNSKPQTKDGKEFELDFKIDAYRDEIQVNKRGSQKKLITSKQAAAGDKFSYTQDEEHTVNNRTAESYAGEFPTTNIHGALPSNEAVMGTDTDLAAANEYLHSIN